MYKMTAPSAMHLVRCIQVSKTGGPEVLGVTDFPITELKLENTEVLIRNSFAGLNFIDTYYRSGLYTKPLPYIAGDEGCGAIVQVGAGIEDKKTALLGQRVAFFKSKGSYSSFVIANVNDVFPVPKDVTDADAAAALLQGCTAHYLTHDCYKVGPGSTVLVHAAAGGTGLFISQICKVLGGTVIGTCGGSEKATIAKDVGKVDHVIDYNATPDWASEVKKIIPSGVDAVYDGVGKSTFELGLTVLRKRGNMVTFGNASGPVDPISPLTLTKYGSLTLQRPKLGDYCEPEEIQKRVADIFGWISEKKIQVLIGKTFKLDDAAKAHEFLQGRASIGKVLINCQE